MKRIYFILYILSNDFQASVKWHGVCDQQISRANTEECCISNIADNTDSNRKLQGKECVSRPVSIYLLEVRADFSLVLQTMNFFSLQFGVEQVRGLHWIRKVLARDYYGCMFAVSMRVLRTNIESIFCCPNKCNKC